MVRVLQVPMIAAVIGVEIAHRGYDVAEKSRDQPLTWQISEVGSSVVTTNTVLVSAAVSTWHPTL